jgi:hypothetical protein
MTSSRSLLGSINRQNMLATVIRYSKKAIRRKGNPIEVIQETYHSDKRKKPSEFPRRVRKGGPSPMLDLRLLNSLFLPFLRIRGNSYKKSLRFEV